MTTVTWKDLFGFDYGPGMPEPVNLRAKRLPRQAPVVAALLALLKTAPSLGAPAPTGKAEGWGQGAVTPHNVGAAVDIYYDSANDTTRAFANGLLELFIRHRVALDWGFIKYNRMNFDQRRVHADESDGAHLNHIHIEWIDYSASRTSHQLSSFEYLDEAGAHHIKTVDGRGQDVLMTWRTGAEQPALPAAFVTDFGELCRKAAMNQRRQAAYTASEFSAAYHGVAIEPALGWLTGWWDVNDGKPYYYYFGPKGFVQYTRTRPASTARPLAVGLNQGVYCMTGSDVLVIDWNPADGGSTVETFSGARAGSTRMAGTSNRYGPLVASRMP